MFRGKHLYMEGSLFEAKPDSLPDRLARRSRTRRPIVAGSAVAAVGYVVVTALLVGIGLLLTKLLLDGAVGRWDASITHWFFDRRTPVLDTVTGWGSRLGDTVAVVAIAALAVVILAIGRHWAHIGFLIAGLLIEVTSFLTTTFLIDRERPTVTHLDAGPPTSSFPSGHTAASVVLYVGLAIIITSLIGNRVVRAFAWVVAIGLPIGVGLSRIYRGMHHPTDVIGAAIGAVACLAFALLATRTGVAVAEADIETGPLTSATPISLPTGPVGAEVAP